MNANDNDTSGGFVFAIVGNGFAIRACTHQEVDAAAASLPHGDPAKSTYVLVICQKCGQAIGSPYLPARDQTPPDEITTICPACGNHIFIDFATLCVRLSTMHPEDNHDEEVFIILQDMRNVGTEAWIDASMQT